MNIQITHEHIIKKLEDNKTKQRRKEKLNYIYCDESLVEPSDDT